LKSKKPSSTNEKEIASFEYGAFRNDAYEAKGLAEQFPKDAKQQVRSIQQAMRGRTMERSQFDEIHAILDDAWKIASAAQQRRHEALEQTQQQWRERMA
jgi:hypothetical protein